MTRMLKSGMTANASGSGHLSEFTGQVALIGAGKMGGAMLGGWIGLGLDPACIAVIEARGFKLNPDPLSLRPDVIVLAVKPQTAPEIVSQVAGLTAPTSVVV